MEVIVDGVIYEIQRRGGISRIYNEILPRSCDIDPTISYTLFAQTKLLKQPVPSHKCIRFKGMLNVGYYLRPRSYWNEQAPALRKALTLLTIGRGENQIWHSTYFTMPALWLGKSVVTVHDMIHERFPHFFQLAKDEVIKNEKRKSIEVADIVICDSVTTRNDILSFYDVNPGKLIVIPLAHSAVFCPIEETANFHSLALPTSKPFLLYVGGRCHYKNFNGFINAYSAWSRYSEVDVLVVGEGFSEAERQFIDELGLRDSLHLLQNVSDEQLCWLYNRALAFVYPSLYEGFGIPLLEAMACGCPIIASSIPSTREVASGYPVYFDIEEPESILSALDSVLAEGRNSPRTRQGTVHAATYSWDKTAQQTLDVYRKLWNEL